MSKAVTNISDKKRTSKLDGWVNMLTGLGSIFKDKRMGAEVQFDLMDETQAEQLYGADDVAANIVDTLPEEALREWITLQFNDSDSDDDLSKQVEDKLDQIGAREKLKEGWLWSRMYGGAGILINVDDSLELEEPINLESIREVRSLTTLSRWELMVTTQDVDLDLQSPRYGQPIWYRFAPRRGGAKGTGLRIHHSRLLRFDGAKLLLRLQITNHYWGDSVLNRAKNAIRNYNISHDAVASVLQEFNQGVFKIKGLADMLYNDQDSQVQKRLEMIQLARSICRAVVIDAEEEFTNVSAALSGVGDLISKVEGRLTVSARMPHDKILGDSPSGLGATGDSENRIWYDFVANQREQVLRNKVRYLLKLILRSRKGPTAGKEPPNWGFEFNPLWQLDEKEQAEVRKTQAETDQIYITTQVIDPDEVAASRFGSGKYSTETTIDLEARASEPGDQVAPPAAAAKDPPPVDGSAPEGPQGQAGQRAETVSAGTGAT